MKYFCFFIVLCFMLSCNESQDNKTKSSTINKKTTNQHQKKPTQATTDNVPTTRAEAPPYLYAWTNNYDDAQAIVNQMASPRGFERTEIELGSFGDWLRFLPLRAAPAPVLLYNGNLKGNQNAHKRVIEIDIGTSDLQQCADALMRLKSEYHYSNGDFAQIHFNYTSGHKVSFDDWRRGKMPIVNGNNVSFTRKGLNTDNSYVNFKKYLNQIFTYAGTASLSKEMKAIDLKDMQIGDVFIQGGHPGHAVIVVDMAVNSAGQKLFLIAQSYMPAQSIHILKNPNETNLNGWYRVGDWDILETPEWSFKSTDLKRFN